MAVVQLQNIQKVYPGGFQAVYDLDLEIPDQQMMVLVGPSGCGKSTTLRMIAGLEDATSGTIRIGDRVVNQVPPKDRDIAMVFQNYALYPHMTVYKNLAFALKLRRTPKGVIEERVAWAAKLLGLEEVLQRRPKALSGGQRQRVAVGRAIVRQPQVFLFDEPLSNLDAKLRVSTRGEIKKLQRQLSTTAVYVTHDQEEAMTLGDLVAVMHQGRLQQCAAPLEIYRRPANLFVAGFVGSPAMNFVTGQLSRQEEQLHFQADHGGVQVELPGDRWKPLLNQVGRRAILGVRPEQLHTVHSASDAHLEGEVQVVELLGAMMDVHVDVSGQPWIARMPTSEQFSVGEKVAFRLDTDQASLFAADSEVGENLLRRA